jgi:CheY-like chemotaxis protein
MKSVETANPSYGAAAPTRATRPSAFATEFRPSLDGVRVLVVDDEADTRRMVAAVLQVYGAQVTLALSASDALGILQHQEFDVLISDLGMDVQDGLSLMREVRSRGIKTPAAALSGYTGIEPQQRAFAAGYQMHLDKPVETLHLAAAVADLAEEAKRSN